MEENSTYIMEKVREILKKNKIIFNIWNFFYQKKLKKIESLKIKGKYTFIDRKNERENLCIILAGYKEFLWEDVFERIKKFLPEDFDVCVVSSGLFSEKLDEICNKNNWSYLYTVENKITLIQNIAINLHSKAKYIYKLDEDMFITRGFFENLKETYLKVLKEDRYKPGFVAPLININGYCYRRILEKTNLLSKFEEKFGKAYMDSTPGEKIIEDPEIAKFLWGKDNSELENLDELSEKFLHDKFEYSICPIRFSIGAIMFPRETWEKMGKFNVYRGNNIGLDEVQICEFCTISSRPMIISENMLVGHFSYGPQTQKMKNFYNEHRKIFSLKK